MDQTERRLQLIQYLRDELPSYKVKYKYGDIPRSADKQRQLLAALMTIRRPKPISDKFLEVQDAYLTQLNHEWPITTADQIPEILPQIHLWTGDITTLGTDAIVNGANSTLLGCFMAGHKCIENAIFNAAGVQLRLACAAIMNKRGKPVEAGESILTPAYNLPSKYILHTVGPSVGTYLTKEQCQKLKDCYDSCLDLAEENHLQSIAFPCLCTGLFGFPKEAAARIAVASVKSWLTRTGSRMHVIFDTFDKEDYAIYHCVLTEKEKN
jgi:O-acetyl-ADP-ribose deacetylase (regulator of RNase III)